MKRVVMAGLVGYAALALTACTPKEAQIAAVLPVTGEFAAYGQSVKNGIELAAAELAKDGAMVPPIKLLPVYDSGSDPQKAAEVTSKAISDGAIGIIGGVTSGEAKAMVPVAEKADTPMISPSASNPELSGISKSFWRIWPSDQAEAAKMAGAAINDLNIKSVVVIAEEQVYARGIEGAFKPAYERLKGTVIETISYPPNTTDVAGLVSRAISLKPEGVYLVDYVDGVAALVTELRKQKFEGRIMTTSAFSTPAAIERAGQAAAGVFLTQTSWDPNSDQTHIKAFREAYKAKFGHLPDIYAAHGYDALKVVAVALKGREPLTSLLDKGLRGDQVKQYIGVTGNIEFDEKGDAKKFPRLYMVSQDLILVDYNDFVKARVEKLEKERRELAERLRAAQTSGN